jgi:hypothetical protein
MIADSSEPLAEGGQQIGERLLPNFVKQSDTCHAARGARVAKDLG